MPKVYLDDEICAKARNKVEALMEAQNDKGLHIQLDAAKALMTHCLNQQRYGLNQQTPADFERAARIPRSGAQQLDNLTPEDLLELQRKMTNDFPGKPA